MSAGADSPARTTRALARRHLRLGWWGLALFVALGLTLESLHGFKARFYLDVTASSRRLMWTLAHAHGALLCLVNIAFALTLGQIDPAEPRQARRMALASAGLLVGTLLVPAGFFLGGTRIHAGDPGLGVLLVPPGALALIAAVVLTARAVGSGKTV